MSEDQEHTEELSTFVEEVRDGLYHLWTALNPEDQEFHPTPELIRENFVIAHRIKGTSLLFDFPGIADLAAELETLLESIGDSPPDELNKVVPRLRELISALITEFDQALQKIKTGAAGHSPATAASPAPSEDGGAESSLPSSKPSATASWGMSICRTDLLPEIDLDVLQFFAREAHSYLETIEAIVPRFENDPQNAELLQSMVHAAHALKGSAYTVGYTVIGDLMRRLEDVLKAVHEGRLVFTVRCTDLFHRAATISRLVLARNPELLDDEVARDVTQILQDLADTISTPDSRDALAAEGEKSSDIPGLVTPLPDRVLPVAAEIPAFRIVALDHGHEVEAAAVDEVGSSASSDWREARDGGASGEGSTSQAPGSSIAPVTQHPLRARDDNYLIPEVDPEIFSFFGPEARECLDTIEASLLQLEGESGNEDLVLELFRNVHTLKGSAYTVGFTVIGDLMHPLEDVLGVVRDGRVAFTASLADVILRSVDVVHLLLRRNPELLAELDEKVGKALESLQQIGSGAPVTESGDASPEVVMFTPSPSSATRVEQSNPAHSSGNGVDAQTHASEAGEHRAERSPMATQAERTGESDVNTVSAVGRVPVESKPVWDQTYLIPDIDPELMSFFGPEARDCLDTIEASLLQLEGDPQNAETLQDLFRNVHTLKGSGYTVGYAVIGDLVHPLEDLLGEIREGRVFFAPRFADLILRCVDLVRLLLKRNPDTVSELQDRMPRTLEELRAVGSAVDAPAGVSAVVGAPSDQTVAAEFRDPPASGSTLEEFDAQYLLPEIDADIMSEFSPEAQEYLNVMEAALLRLEKDEESHETIQQLYRGCHALKGAAFGVGFLSIGDLVRVIEEITVAVMEGRVRFSPALNDLMLRAVDVNRALLRRDPRMAEQLGGRFREVKRKLTGFTLFSPGQASMAPASMALASDDAMPAKMPEQRPSAAEPGAQSKDGRSTTVIRVSQERLENLLNMVGEVVIARGRLDRRLRMLQQISQQVVSFQNRMLESVRSFEDKHMFTLQKSDTVSDEANQGTFSALPDFGALEFDKYDDVNILARRVGEVSADVSESMSQLHASIRQAREDMSQLQQLTVGMRDEISQARMLPIGTPFVRFRRAVREMARTTGKEVSLVTSGEATEVDTGVVERLVDPLIHLVRNAVYHGIEPSHVRVAAGKPPAGHVYLHAAHRGNSVILEVEDDGAGMDVEKIKAKAVSLGFLSPEDAGTLSQSDAINLIFLPNFSTADQVGDQAGRGVGMDVVKRAIESIGGRIAIETVKGVGTKFTLELPLTLLITTAVFVRVGDERYAIPLVAIREVLMARPEDIKRVGDRGMIQVGDEVITVKPLAEVLRSPAAAPAGPAPVVVARTPGGPFGLVVDELLGRQEIVIKSLGKLKILQHACFGGATIDPEGRVVLVLDVAQVSERPEEQGVAVRSVADGAVPRPGRSAGDANVALDKVETPSILLVDDSLSIRKFVGRMLEAAGYDVDTAVDGEEGLRKARERSYRLIITDLEMPKVNGYEVIQALRARPHTESTPVIVMTTRTAEKHRQMAMNLGASAYLTKPVMEHALMQEVTRWLGERMTTSA